ncbi:SURF1 family cytochrome oxidase biogenesis protein [Cellulomonas sp. NPDC055163]
MRPHVRRALALVLVALVVATGCTFAGRWQWNRHVARDALIRVVERNYAAEPVRLDEVLPSADAELGPDDVWRRAVVTGRYLPEATVLLRNRPVESTPGYHVLVPLVVEDGGEPGTVLVVNRGFVGMGTDGSAAVDVPPPPAGSVEVTVRLRLDEPRARAAAAGQVHAIAVAQVLGQAPDDTALDGLTPYRAYGALADEAPAPAQSLVPLPAPSTDPGSHLSYAFQWWTFALGALVGFSVMARRELVDARAEGEDEPGTPGPDGDGNAPTPPRPPRAARAARRERGPSAEDVEDALIDAQLR